MAGGRRLRSLRGPELGDQVLCGRPDAARSGRDSRPRGRVTGFGAGLAAPHGNTELTVGVCAIAIAIAASELYQICQTTRSEPAGQDTRPHSPASITPAEITSHS